MSQKKVIELVTELDSKGLDELNTGLNKVDKSSKNVEVQSEKTASSIKKVGENGGAISTLDSLTGGLATRIRDAAEASQLFNGSLKATRGALIATGIGAFVVALGVVVAYWDEIVDYVNGVNKALEAQNEIINRNLDTLDFEIKLLEAKESLLEAEGKSTEEIVQQKRKIILLQQEQNELLLENLRTQLEREKVQVQEVTRWEKIKIAALQAANLWDRAGMARAEAIVGDEEERAAIADLEKRLQDATLRSEALKLSLFNLDNPVSSDRASVRQTEETVDRPNNLEAIQSEGLKEIEIIQSIEDAKTEVYLHSADQRRAILEGERIEAERIAAAEAEYKVQTAANVLGALQGIAEEGSAGAKAIAVAQAVLSTYQGINKALAETTDFTPTQSLRFLNAALVGVAGFANVAKILSTDSSGKSTPTGISSNIGGQGAPAAPSFNVVGQGGVNQLADTLNQDQNPVRAFVVGSDVTTQQELDNNLVNTANIGT